MRGATDARPVELLRVSWLADARRRFPQGGDPIAATHRRRSTVSPFAGAWHLYLLGVGLMLGLLLGPAVFGRVAPEAYAQWFLGRGEAATQLQAFDDATRDGLMRLAATGVTEIAIQEYLDRRTQEREASPDFLQAAVDRAEQAQANTDRLMAIVVVVVLLMGVEAWAGPSPPTRGRAVVSPALGRLVTIRYALMAMWLALALAEPAALLRLPWAFATALLIVGLVAGLVPLAGRTAAGTTS